MLQLENVQKNVSHVNTNNIYLNSSPNILNQEWSNLKVFADDRINVIEKLKFVLGRGRKQYRKRVKKCCLLAFSPFPMMFS